MTDAYRGGGRPLADARAARACAVAALLLTGACGSSTGLDIDPDRFDPLPEVGELDFATVGPAASWSYWELRFQLSPTSADSIVGSGGPLSREELAAEVRETLDETAPPTGFAVGCLPGSCFKFVAAVDDDEVVTFATKEALRDFLGLTESLAEAVILLDANGFNWYDEDQGIRRLDDGWEAVVLELVRACDPVQTDRVLVQVTHDGSVVPIQREVWSRADGACI